MSLYLADGINADAVLNYLKESADIGTLVRTIKVIKGDEPIIKIAMKPYDVDALENLYVVGGRHLLRRRQVIGQ